ncbi:helix-turn-helix domain-containing protein [Kallotenue papyrolyticum]|uniref:helix-turn-helix domain-containing protein n=1 Tax=Kallotenue papyrolyticum TaxID=1325125 RepID=UPI000471FC7E|nr:helix-turn-helix domain-containing protein [Kallotenue papyrolyticum]
MRQPLPPIHESIDDLKGQFTQERHPVKRARLHALYLLASAQAHSRQEVARLLGVDRNTVGRWLTTYRHGGLATLLNVYVLRTRRQAQAVDA